MDVVGSGRVVVIVGMSLLMRGYRCLRAIVASLVRSSRRPEMIVLIEIGCIVETAVLNLVRSVAGTDCRRRNLTFWPLGGERSLRGWRCCYAVLVYGQKVT